MEMEMEMEVEEIEFKLLLPPLPGSDKLNPVPFMGRLLKYFGWFNELYTLHKYKSFNEDADFALKESLWLYILSLYKEHDDLYGNESGLIEPLQPFTPQSKQIELIDLYRIVRTSNYYDMPLMLDFALALIMRRLFGMPRQKLYEANPEAVILTPQEIYTSVLKKPIQRVVMHYNIRREEMLAIFRRYIGVKELISSIKRLYLPKSTSVIACGQNYIMALTQAGTLMGFGDNTHGQLCVPREANQSKSIWHESTFSGVISLWCGQSHTLLLKATGLYGCGYNEHGQLGIGGTRNDLDMYALSEATRIDLDGILAASCGSSHSIILTRYGVYGCGRNAFGQLGNGITVATRSPQPMDFKERVIAVAVSCGEDYSLVLTKQGRVYGCGLNTGGVLGVDPQKEMRLLSPELIKMPDSVTKIVAISAGAYHALFLDDNGRVFATGENSHGELGLGDTNNRYIAQEVYASTKPTVSIIAGARRSFFIDEDGDLYACGSNEYGRTGLDMTSLLPMIVPGLSDVISVACGEAFSVVLTCNGLFLIGNQDPNNVGEGVLQPPRRMRIVINQMPICGELALPPDSPPKKKKESKEGLQCSFCGCRELDKIAIHYESNRLFCMDDCLLRYQQFRV